MKKHLLSLMAVAFFSTAAIAQTLTFPITFEDGIFPGVITTQYPYGAFRFNAGVTGSVVNNPKVEGINTSAKVATFTSGGTAFFNLDLNKNGQSYDTKPYDRFSLKMYVTDAAGTAITNISTVKLQLDGNSTPATEVIDVAPVYNGAWATVTFTIPKNRTYQMLQVRLNQARTGTPATAATDVYYFDDVRLYDSALAGVEKVSLNSNVYPSVLKKSSSLNVELENAENISMDIFSVNGMMVKNIFKGNPNATSFSVPVELSASGVYLLRIKNDDGRTSYKKLIVE